MNEINNKWVKMINSVIFLYQQTKQKNVQIYIYIYIYIYI